jgi:transcriptional regulator with XRE-family HTH domain
MTASPLERAADDFAASLAAIRTERGLSKRALAAEMGFDPSYVSHVEGGRHRPTADFARRAEVVLRAGGVIWKSYEAYVALRQAPTAVSPVSTPDMWLPPGTGLAVEREQAALGFRDDRYHVRVRRDLYNAGAKAVVRFPVYVGSGDWYDIGFFGRLLGSDGNAEPMTWRASRDWNAANELWLHFENDDARFPLYPGERAALEYGFSVPAQAWGSSFQRAVRWPTRDLSVLLDFPSERRPSVWGTVSSLSAEAAPLDSPIRSTRDDDRTRFTWTIGAPMLQARYRFEWRYRA